MFTTTTRRRSGGRPGWFTWLAVLMFMVSLTPAATSYAAGFPGASLQQAELAQTGEGSFIEVHVSACDPGTTGTAQELRDICHDNGIADVQMDVSSVDPALGIDLVDKTTERINGAGPGIINTGTIPAGEYLITVDIPGDLSSFVVGCEFFDRDETVPVTPDDSQVFRVTVPQGEDVVCDLYVTPQGGNGTPEEIASTLDFTVKSCDRNDLVGDDRSFEELSANCTAVPAAPNTPIEITVEKSDGQPETQPLDSKGVAIFDDLVNGDYDVSSDINLDSAGQYLFCEYTGQPRYEKDFNASGVTTFSSLLGEEINCDWFVVSVPQEANPTATTAPTAAVEPTAATAPTVPAEPTATTAPEQLASISVDVSACPTDYDVATNGEGGATFATNCAQPTGDVLLTLTDSAGQPIEIFTAEDGSVVFSDLDPDTYTLFSGVPLEAASEYLYCMAGDGVEYQKDFNDRGVTTFSNVESEQIECSWYIVPESQRGEETGATVTVHLAVCPQDYAGDQFFADCHANGVADMEYTLTGPNGAMTGTTTIPSDPGPGVTTFTKLPAGEYTLAGGPPQDFGSVALYCSDPATGTSIDAPMNGGMGTFSIADQQSILCDWYFIPQDARGDVTPTPTPTEVARRAEILVTLFACEPGMETAGATFAQLDEACGTTVNDVNVSLGIPGGTPLSAATGASGEGAVRFYDLRAGNYVMTPSLPSGYTSAAIYCQIGDGDVYQKTLQSGSTTFVNVDGDQIACSWFLAPIPKPQPQKPAGPSGSITVREFLCEGDRTSIKDWERECVPGVTESAFTLKSSDGVTNNNARPNDQGVLVFGDLPDGYYELSQDTGVWCKAAAERVDSRSRVIVRDGGNTDVFIYECGQVTGLPDTGSGPLDGGATIFHNASIILAALAVPAFGAALWQIRRTQPEPVRVEARQPQAPNDHREGDTWMRFR